MGAEMVRDKTVGTLVAALVAAPELEQERVAKEGAGMKCLLG